MATTTQNEFLTCPHCGNEMTYAAEAQGMTSQCPHCNQPVVLAGAPRAVEIQPTPVSTPEPSNRSAGFWASCSDREKGRITVLGAMVAIALATLILGLCGVEPFSLIVRAWFPDAWFPEDGAR